MRSSPSASENCSSRSGGSPTSPTGSTTVSTTTRPFMVTEAAAADFAATHGRRDALLVTFPARRDAGADPALVHAARRPAAGHPRGGAHGHGAPPAPRPASSGVPTARAAGPARPA